MIKSTLIGSPSPGAAGLFLSILVHIIILTQLIFILPQQSTPQKPYFTFLGSILQGDKIFQKTIPKNIAQKNDYQDFTYKKINTQENPAEKFKVQKPKQKDQKETLSKIDIKTIFELKTEDRRDLSSFLEGLGLTSKTPRYQHLQMKE